MMIIMIFCLQIILDNMNYLRQFILRYTVGNPMSLHHVAFHWLASGFTQLKWQQFHYFEEKLYKRIRMWIFVILDKMFFKKGRLFF